MYLERNEYLEECLSKELPRVPKKVVKQWGLREGVLAQVLMPALSAVFALPGQGASEGSPAWMKSVLLHDRFTFQHLVNHPKLMNRWLEKMLKALDDRGEIPLEAGEQVPDGEYSRDTSYKFLPTGVFKPTQTPVLKPLQTPV